MRLTKTELATLRRRRLELDGYSSPGWQAAIAAAADAWNRYPMLGPRAIAQMFAKRLGVRVDAAWVDEYVKPRTTARTTATKG